MDYERIKKWMIKRADYRNRDRMWKRTQNHKMIPAYDHGYIDAMNQCLEFIKYLEKGPPAPREESN